MLKIFVLSLLAVSCSGIRTEQDPTEAGATETGAPGRYRLEVQNLLGFIIHPLQCIFYNEKNVKFYLYTNQVPQKYELKLDDIQYLENSSYDISRQVKIIVHDWLFSANYTRELVTAYLRHSPEPVNVIQVDYSFYSRCQADHFMSRIYADVGETVAKLLQQLNNHGTSSHMMHAIGFGAGAHIAAVAAKRMHPTKLARITGLDPVGFNFDLDKTIPQLQAADAEFVDVIMTNAGQVGSILPRGLAQFFPHGGNTQYGGMADSHVKSMFYMVESIARGNTFKSYVSNSWADFKLGRYRHNEYSYMGEYASKNVTGDLFVEVNRLPPYGQEEDESTRQQQITYEQESYPHTYLSLLMPKSRAPMQVLQNQQGFGALKQYRKLSDF